MRIWGSINVMPKHIWEGQDPLTFKYYDPEQGLPLGTGPYKLQASARLNSPMCMMTTGGALDRRLQVPAPKKLVWTWASPESTRTALMADGNLDSLMDITLGALQAFKPEPECHYLVQ